MAFRVTTGSGMSPFAAAIAAQMVQRDKARARAAAAGQQRAALEAQERIAKRGQNVEIAKIRGARQVGRETAEREQARYKDDQWYRQKAMELNERLAGTREKHAEGTMELAKTGQDIAREQGRSTDAYRTSQLGIEGRKLETAEKAHTIQEEILRHRGDLAPKEGESQGTSTRQELRDASSVEPLAESRKKLFIQADPGWFAEPSPGWLAQELWLTKDQAITDEARDIGDRAMRKVVRSAAEEINDALPSERKVLSQVWLSVFDHVMEHYMSRMHNHGHSPYLRYVQSVRDSIVSGVPSDKGNPYPQR